MRVVELERGTGQGGQRCVGNRWPHLSKCSGWTLVLPLPSIELLSLGDCRSGTCCTYTMNSAHDH
jgi:hypothetical protein